MTPADSTAAASHGTPGPPLSTAVLLSHVTAQRTPWTCPDLVNRCGGFGYLRGLCPRSLRDGGVKVMWPQQVLPCITTSQLAAALARRIAGGNRAIDVSVSVGSNALAMANYRRSNLSP